MANHAANVTKNKGSDTLSGATFVGMVNDPVGVSGTLY